MVSIRSVFGAATMDQAALPVDILPLQSDQFTRREERRGAARGRQRGLPFVGRAGVADRQGRHPMRRLENARHIFGALDIAREPVQVVGGAGEHAAYPSSTQVSLVPPPWLELTTREPGSSATRVSPPGTMRTRSRPMRTNGRKSTWRGANPSPTQVGHVESASVGWAMNPCGWRSILARKAASVSRSAFGPIIMP